MPEDRLAIYAAASALDRGEMRDLDALRPGAREAELTPGGPPYRVFWARVLADAPGDPPDERYYADEVRPCGIDAGGHLTWEKPPDGLEAIVVHNVAEAGAGSHLLAADAVVRVEARLDRSSPPEKVYTTHATVAAASWRLARVVSYSDGTYTVQPVRRETGGYVSDGDPVSGVPNLGELWPDEAGYLAGPSGFDRYVPIWETPAGWVIILHPPRMV